MTRLDTLEDVRELDVRTLDEPPFGPIMAALDDLEPGETLCIRNSFEPVPLYEQLENRGFTYRTEQVDADEWQVFVEHVE